MTKYKDEKKKKRIKRKEKNYEIKNQKWEKKDFIGPYLIRLLTVSVISRVRIKKNGRYFRIISATEKWNRMKKYKILRNIKFSFFKIFFIYICIKIPLLIKKRIHFLLSFLPKDNFQ